MDGLIRRSVSKPAVLLVALASLAIPAKLLLRALEAPGRPTTAAARTPGADSSPGAAAGEHARAASTATPAPEGKRSTREVRGRGAALVRWRGSSGWGVASRYQRLYDPARVITVRGRVLRLEEVRPFVEMGAGLQALVSTDLGVVRVHLGPRWFLEQQDAPLRAGFRVDVTGAVALLGRREVLIASEVRAAGRVLRLRDGLGLPFWSWARHPQPPEAEE